MARSNSKKYWLKALAKDIGLRQPAKTIYKGNMQG